MMEIDKEQRDAFLRELTELTLKYRIEIWACGCCNSPCLFPLEKGGRYATADFAPDEFLKFEKE